MGPCLKMVCFGHGCVIFDRAVPEKGMFRARVVNVFDFELFVGSFIFIFACVEVPMQFALGNFRHSVDEWNVENDSGDEREKIDIFGNGEGV